MSKFYAIYTPDLLAFNRATLYRYDTAKQRAEDVDRVNNAHFFTERPVMQPVTRGTARKLFPRAFNPAVIVWRTWSDGDRHFARPWWRDYEDGTQEYTGRPGE